MRNKKEEKAILNKIGKERVKAFAKEYEALCKKYGLRIKPLEDGFWGNLGIEVNFIDDYFENFFCEVEEVCEMIK